MTTLRIHVARTPELGRTTLRRSVPWRLWLGTILLLCAWQPLGLPLWDRWFPLWHQHGTSLWEKLAGGETYYRHAPLVVLTALLLARHIHRQQSVPESPQRRDMVLGWTLLGASLLLQALAILMHVRILLPGGLLLLTTTAAMLLLTGGARRLTNYLPALLLLLFALPLPVALLNEVSLQLKWLVAQPAAYLAQVPSLVDGSLVHLTPDAHGQPRTLIIDDVCGGLRSLVGLLWLGATVAAFSRCRPWGKLALLLATVPVALGANVLRIAATIVLAHHCGLSVVGPEQPWHHLLGLASFGLAGLVLILMGRLLPKAARKSVAASADPRPNPARRLPGLALGLLGLTATLALAWPARGEPLPPRLDAQAIPLRVTAGDLTLHGQDQPLDARTLRMLHGSAALRRSYADARHQSGLELLLVTAARTDLLHPPDLCLAGTGAREVQRDVAMLPNSGDSLTFVRLVTSDGRNTVLHYYAYACGGTYTPDLWRCQMSGVWRELWHDDSRALLLRVSLPVGRGGLSAADAMARQFLAELAPAAVHAMR